MGYCVYYLRGRDSGDVHALLYASTGVNQEDLLGDIQVDAFRKIMRPRPKAERERLMVDVVTVNLYDWWDLLAIGVPVYRAHLDFYDYWDVTVKKRETFAKVHLCPTGPLGGPPNRR